MRGNQNISEYGKATRFKAGEQRTIEAGRKGGKRSDIGKRLNALLTEKTTTASGEAVTYEEAICLAMIEEALKGNVSAFRAIHEAMEKYIIRVTADDENDDDNVLAFIRYMTERKNET